MVKTRPDWMTEEAEKKAKKSYLLKGETVLSRFHDIAHFAAIQYPDYMYSDLFFNFYNLLVDGILAPSTPVWSNFGRERGLPISCFGNAPDDNLLSIFEANTENALLSKAGGGTSMYLGHLRHRGASIGAGGISTGAISWLNVAKSRVSEVNQNGIRRGAEAAYIEFSSPDFAEVINWKRHNEDYHIGINIRDKDIKLLELGNKEALNKWQLLLKTRMETGEPYLHFVDKANKYSTFNKPIYSSNLCNEIAIPSDSEESFVCCLSSLNALHFEQWESRKAVKYGTYFLMAVMQDFIRRVKHLPKFEKVLKCAVDHRPLGLGVLGYHSYLQSKILPFDSLQAEIQNHLIFKHLCKESHLASKELVKFFGFAKDQSRANAVTLAVAPNTNSAFLCGEVSRGIEPFMGNYTIQIQDKKTIERKNLQLQKVLQDKGVDTPETWNQIAIDKGSVKNLTCLTDEEKDVFKTAFEVNQISLLRQANTRAQYIDQSQSLNLFLTSNHTPQEIHELHVYAAKSSHIKGLYYCRSSKSEKAETSCEACSS